MAKTICLLFATVLTLSSIGPAYSAVVAFTGGDYNGWQSWNWTTITHLGFWTAPPDSVRAMAKQNGVRLFQDAHLPDSNKWTDSSARKDFAKDKVAQVQSAKLDGVFFDYEGNTLNSDEKNAYAKLAQEVSDALKPYNASLFVCVGGRPTYEFRDYDYKGLADASEFLFIMGYDMHFWDDYTCVVHKTCSPAEAPIKDLKAGVQEYLQQVPPQKLVLGLPWYGMIYEQILVPISIAQISYADILGVFDDNRVSKKTFDSDSSTWKIDCKDTCVHGKKGGVIWYDDAKSLAPKYKLAKDNHLLGVGMWKADNLPVNGSSGDPHAEERKEMWNALTAWNVTKL